MKKQTPLLNRLQMAAERNPDTVIFIVFIVIIIIGSINGYWL
jgi:hypothetical protein